MAEPASDARSKAEDHQRFVVTEDRR